jgi:16S rRNA (guanine527-N7)-methyltransferase
VTSNEFRTQLMDRAQRANVVLAADVLGSLEAYLSILTRWNARMNLTALPVANPTADTLDRLIIEPLAAARHVSDDGGIWFDLGSGGGSPAIPLKIARPSLRLVMVESKARKAAFLREVIRSLDLKRSTVENARFEDVAANAEIRGMADLVTVRAVRADETLFDASAELLKDSGRLLMFRPSGDELSADGFAMTDTVQLIDPDGAFLAIFSRVFHVEQRD